MTCWILKIQLYIIALVQCLDLEGGGQHWTHRANLLKHLLLEMQIETSAIHIMLKSGDFDDRAKMMWFYLTRSCVSISRMADLHIGSEKEYISVIKHVIC